MTNPDLKALFGPIAVTTLALVVCTGPALGADSFFGTESPLLKFVDFIVGAVCLCGRHHRAGHNGRRTGHWRRVLRVCPADADRCCGGRYRYPCRRRDQ